MRRLALILILCLVLMPVLTACGEDEAVTAEEILPVARALIERSVLANDVMIGGGPPKGDLAFGEYYHVDQEWQSRYGIDSVEDLLSYVASVYTTTWYDRLYEWTITKDGVEPPDYQNRGAPATGLLVYAGRSGRYDDTTVYEYLYDTMTMTASTANTATVTLTVRITPDGCTPQERELSLNLLYTQDGWRCDKLTYVAYDASSVN